MRCRDYSKNKMKTIPIRNEATRDVTRALTSAIFFLIMILMIII